MKLLHPTTREEWLTLRHGYVSSTESAALFGMSKYGTAFELAVAKSGNPALPDSLIEVDFNDRMRWGLRLQDSIANGISVDYGVSIREVRSYAAHEDTRMGASFDYEITGMAGVVISEDSILRSMWEQHGPGILEIKNVDKFVYLKEWTDGEAPDHIEIQLQHQLETIGYEWGVIAALIGGNRTEVIVRKRDRAVGKAIVAKIDEFWRNLDAGIMPPIVMPDDAEFLIKLYGYAEVGKLYDGRHDDELLEMCNSYTQHATAEKVAQEGKEIAKAKILQRIGAAEKALLPKFSVSAGMVAGCHISYDRKPYRNFRVTPKKETAK